MALWCLAACWVKQHQTSFKFIQIRPCKISNSAVNIRQVNLTNCREMIQTNRSRSGKQYFMQRFMVEQNKCPKENIILVALCQIQWQRRVCMQWYTQIYTSNLRHINISERNCKEYFKSIVLSMTVCSFEECELRVVSKTICIYSEQTKQTASKTQ